MKQAEKSDASDTGGGRGAEAKRRLAAALVYALLTLIAADIIVQRTGLWYWAPLTEGRLLKFFALYTDKRRYDVLILGSSISRLGFLPAVMEEELSARLPDRPPPLVYNASVNGALLPAHLDVMRGIVGKKQNPKVILLMVSPRAFNSAEFSHMPREAKYFSRNPSDFFSLLMYSPRAKVRWGAVNSLAHGLESCLQISQFFKKRYRDAVLDYRARHGAAYFYPFTPAAKRKNKFVYHRPEKTLQKLRKARARIIRRREIVDFEITPLIDKWLHEIAAQARNKNSELIILMAPESEWLKKNVYFKEKIQSVEYLKSFCEREGIKWHDLGKPPFRPDDREYIEGCNHLGYAGAGKLSRAVAREIVAPLFAK